VKNWKVYPSRDGITDVVCELQWLMPQIALMAKQINREVT